MAKIIKKHGLYLSSYVLAALVACTVSGAAASERAAICSIEQAVACAPFLACERNLPGAFNFPVLFKLDAINQQLISISEDGTELSSGISSMVETDTALVLSGADSGQPWTASISRETGRMSATIIQEDDTFVLFGVCSTKLMQ